ncbi:MAG: protease pro-enzyme activation domain-containing protein [Firmicutes bacterium]|nr:protease pro-enzyme activation domain-containing protein [Bacillota bacterium]
MPAPRFLAPLLGVAAFNLLLFSSIADAATLRPDVLYRPGASGLPATPAYANAAVFRDLSTLHSSAKERVVDVVVDSPARIQALQAYSAAVSNPSSPWFHHFLTPAQLNRQFGPTAAMVSQAESTMVQAGWQVLARQGLVVAARVPGASRSPGLPVSPDIWSMSGFAPHGIIRRHAAPSPVVTRRPSNTSQASAAPAMSLAGENFNQPPVVLQQTTASNGDVVSVMSWNPLVKTSVPAGLPLNLFVTVEDPQGNFLPISNVGNVNDTVQSLVSYGAAAMPSTSNTLWQLPIAAWQDVAAGDTLTLQVTLNDGTNLNASFPLPAFTGPATALSPLTGQQMNAFSGLKSFPAHLGAVALFTVGAPPSQSDLSLFLGQNTTVQGNPPITFHYEDGATASEAGQTSDSEESQLDLEAVAGAAPGAPIEEYIYPENDNNDPLISYLTDLSQQSTAKIASLSYGFYGEDPSTLTTLMNALTAEGITFLEASGDQGAWNGGIDPGPVGLSSLEQVPSVLSVGGMDLAAPATTDASGSTTAITGPAIAKAWGGDYLNGIPVGAAGAYTNLNAATSGGYSSTTPIPSWENGFLPSGATGFGVPIIATEAGYPGLSGYLQGQNVVFGGTSLAAPLTAGWLDDVESLLNLTSTGMGDINPLLFQAAKANSSMFTQALWGADGVYSIANAKSGTWNPMTGLGMVNWQQFIAQYYSLVPSGSPSASLATPVANPQSGNPISVVAQVGDIAEPHYQFWVESPQNQSWHSLGAYSTTPTATFTPNVPGTWTVKVFVKGANGVVTTSHLMLKVASTQPMVSSLAMTLSNVANPVPQGTALTISTSATQSGGTSPIDYQFWIHGPNDRWTVAQDYSPESQLALGPLSPGSYTIAVYALTQSALKNRQWNTAFYQTTVINVASQVALNLPSSASTGNLATIGATATHLTNPVYQFWIEPPTGPWQASGSYSHQGSWSFVPTVAGTYHVVVYAKDPYAPATAAFSVVSSEALIVSP